MASQQSTVDYIVEQAAAAGAVRAQKIFGEYGLYCDGKLVALICNDQLFVKPTKAGRRHIGAVNERPPYQGAKLLIPGDRWDDSDWPSPAHPPVCRRASVAGEEAPADRDQVTNRDDQQARRRCL